MSELLKPFAALRANKDIIDDVISPPYDVITSEQAKAFVKNKPNNFLYLTKPEISDVINADIYQQGLANLQRYLHDNIIQQDNTDSFYLYQIDAFGQVQTGLVALYSSHAYLDNTIRKHEYTRPEKENDRAKLIAAQKAQLSPVLLAYKNSAQLNSAIMHALKHSECLYQVQDLDGHCHKLLRCNDGETVKQLNDIFNKEGQFYIADGHHRSAAAAKCTDHFLAAAFPADEMTVQGYHRVVKDLAGHKPSDFLHALKRHFTVQKMDRAVIPTQKNHFAMLLDKQWYQLTFTGQVKHDPVSQLDVSIIQETILQPLLDIQDVRNDQRIDFVGGDDAIETIEALANENKIALAFLLAATSVDELMKVADNNQVMPPKSTWFAPKLVDGLIAYRW